MSRERALVQFSRKKTRSVAFLFSPQQLMFLADEVYSGNVPAGDVYLFFPLTTSMEQFPGRVMRQTCAQVRPIFGQGKFRVVPTLKGARILTIAMAMRLFELRNVTPKVVISGVPTSGLIERTRLARSAERLILIDDGQAAKDLDRHFYPDLKSNSSFRRRSMLAARVAGPRNSLCREQIELVSMVPKIHFQSERSSIDVVLKLNQLEALRQYLGNSSQSTPSGRRVLIGTNLRNFPSETVAKVLISIVEKHGIQEYRAHRHEDPSVARRVKKATGVQIQYPTLPLELELLIEDPGHKYFAPPSNLTFHLSSMIGDKDRIIHIQLTDELFKIPGLTEEQRSYLELLEQLEIEGLS